jgi:hypothetical protein
MRGVPTFEKLTGLDRHPDPSTLLFSPRTGADEGQVPARGEAGGAA